MLILIDVKSKFWRHFLVFDPSDKIKQMNYKNFI